MTTTVQVLLFILPDQAASKEALRLLEVIFDPPQIAMQTCPKGMGEMYEIPFAAYEGNKYYGLDAIHELAKGLHRTKNAITAEKIYKKT